MDTFAVSSINMIATLILALITAWYACSTYNILKEMKSQSNSMRDQMQILIKNVEVSALSALTTAAGHPSGENPFEKLREIVKQLESKDED